MSTQNENNAQRLADALRALIPLVPFDGNHEDETRKGPQLREARAALAEYDNAPQPATRPRSSIVRAAAVIIEEVGPLKVRVSREGVAMFNAQWPDSELRSTRAYWYEFDAARNLIDCDVPNEDDGLASLALSQDCERFLFDGETPEWVTE